MIDVSKFRMHDIGCARANYKCKVCGEVVPKAEKDEHETNAHKKIECQYCKYSEIAANFGNHEEHCELRPKPCEYCEKLFGIEKYMDHVEMCGTRTEKCADCQRFICLKDKKTHKLPGGKCQKYQAENKRNEELEKMKAMEELRKFQEKEEADRIKKKEE